MRFARDRIVELHFWILGLVDEPYHSYARITLTKFILIGSLFDDFYDNYSTTEESNIFTDAIERSVWLVHHFSTVFKGGGINEIYVLFLILCLFESMSTAGMRKRQSSSQHA